MAEEPTSNTVGWYILEGYPWWPVYICDQFKLRPNLHLLGNGHRKILKKSKDFPKDYALVYYFGSHDFSCVSRNKGVLKPWDCPEREMFLKGHPKHLVKKKPVIEELQFAIQEAEDYLSQPDDIRLPPHMVPSDLDPTLEPPPPIDRTEMDEDDGEEVDGHAEDEGGEEASDDEDAGGGGDDLMDGSDGEKKKKKKKKKKSPTAKEKKEKIKSTKEKAKSKKLESKETEMKKASSSKKKNSDNEDKTTKRRRSSSSKPGESETSPKKARTELGDQNGDATSADLSNGEDLAALLEKEIRWILVNCPFEEMTTKMVRKFLEERLNRDLRSHKAEIKAGVERVIASMEDEEASEQPNDSQDAKMDVHAEAVVKAEEPQAEPAMVVEESASIKTEPTSPPHTESRNNEEPPIKEEDTATAKQEDVESAMKTLEISKTDLTLAGDDEPKILEVLNSLKGVVLADKNDLSVSGLLQMLIHLRAHRKNSIADVVGELAMLWKAEDMIPAPKPVNEDELLDLKKKLSDTETTHDELLSCLTDLEKMPIEITHLKKTGISRVVAGLRQHANDKVSIAAKNLRNAWMQLIEKESPGSNHNRTKKLEKMNEILESDQESDSAKLAVLEKLYKMTLSTQDIIASKIGVIVSKLRKSGNDDIVRAASKLRKKWKTEAGAA